MELCLNAFSLSHHSSDIVPRKDWLTPDGQWAATKQAADKGRSIYYVRREGGRVGQKKHKTRAQLGWLW